MIDLLPNDDQQALIENFRTVLEAEAPVSRLRDGTRDDDLIARLAALGWTGLGLPEESGGVGLGICEEVLLFREAGRHLVGPGLLAAVLAGHAAAETEDHDLAAALASGARRAALVTSDGRYRFDGQEGDVCVWPSPRGTVLFEATGAAEEIAALDGAVRLERLTTLPAVSGNGDVRLVHRAALLVSAMLVGLAERARDMATDYAKDRQQFGQPIGAFQAIKHRCADMAVACEAAWTLTVFAALAHAEDRADCAFQTAAARIVAGDAALAAVRGNIQIHGGMGFTDECDAQLLVKRCHLWLQALGDARVHKAALLAAPEPMRAA